MPPDFSTALHVAAVGIGVASVWYLTDPSTPQAMPKSELVEILRELNVAFHPVLTKLAKMAASVVDAMKKKDLSQHVKLEQLESALMSQGFREALAEKEEAIYAAHGFAQPAAGEAALALALERNTDDETVKELKEGLRVMYADAISGMAPILVGTKVPESLTEEKVLEILTKIQAAKQKKFKEVVTSQSNRQATVTEILDDKQQIPLRSFAASSHKTSGLAAELQAAAGAAETSVLSEQLSTIGTPAHYHNAMALYSRQSQFRTKKDLLEQLHTEAVLSDLQGRSDGVTTLFDGGVPTSA